MKKTLLAIAAAAMFVACGPKSYTINGIADDEHGMAEGAVVYMHGTNGTIVDSCAVEDGKFFFKGPVNKDEFIALELSWPGKDPRFEQRMAALIPDAKNIVVCLNDSTYVDGSPLTDKYNEVDSELMRLFTEAENDSAIIDYCRKIFLENPDNAIGAQAFSCIMYEIDLETFDELVAKAGKAIREDPRLESVRAGKLAEQRTGPGSDFIDFSGTTPEGEPVSLSDFVGKGNYTLVDFWASWCGPCMRSMPGMKKIYEEFGPKGLQVVGVAVWDGDNSRSRVRIEEKGMTWPQIFMGEDKTPTDTYGILGIPHVIIFDPDGKVVSRQTPDEEDLYNQVSELFK